MPWADTSAAISGQACMLSDASLRGRRPTTHAKACVSYRRDPSGVFDNRFSKRSDYVFCQALHPLCHACIHAIDHACIQLASFVHVLMYNTYTLIFIN